MIKLVGIGALIRSNYTKAGGKVDSLEHFLFHFFFSPVRREIENVEAGVSHWKLGTAWTSIHLLNSHLGVKFNVHMCVYKCV